MTDLIAARLYNQRLSHTQYDDPVDVVRWLGAVQAQDYAAATWAVAQRTTGVTVASLERAFGDGRILRTHVMRPTWHFVTPADIRWLLALTAPRVRSALGHRDRLLGLDETVLAQSNPILVAALQGNTYRTRAELAAALEQAGIPASSDRMVHILMHAELDGLICSGPRRGKQFTYALLEERAPQARSLPRDNALAELTRRYITSHGPATVKDFAWWSGLTTAEARTGFELAGPDLVEEEIDGETYWSTEPVSAAPSSDPAAYLLSNYDEYIVGYTDRSAIFDNNHAEHLDARGNILFQNTVILDGQVVGTWKRTIEKHAVIIETTLFAPLERAQTQAIEAAAERYGAFLGLPVEII